MRIVGDVLALLLDGMSVLSMLACSLRSCFVCSSFCIMCCRLVCLIIRFSLFLYSVCCLVLCGEGFFFRFWCSSCCLLICRLNFVVHHGCLRRVVGFSCRSMVCWMAVWMLLKCCEVAVYVVVLSCAVMMAAWISGRMVALCFVYLRADSVALVLVCSLFTFSWNIVYMGRWSDIGGDMVPAVTDVCVSVVKTTSMSVPVSWNGSYLVGVVIVVCRLFSTRKS